MDIKLEKPHVSCRFSSRVPSCARLTCGDVRCLTRCHRASVSNSCHFFRERPNQSGDLAKLWSNGGAHNRTITSRAGGTTQARLGFSTRDNFDWQGRHGTYGGSNTDKIDYILLSPDLFERVLKGGVFRKGVWRGPKTRDPWEIYPTLTAKVHEASDHAAVWAELDL
jgi:hypothetical protein